MTEETEPDIGAERAARFKMFARLLLCAFAPMIATRIASFDNWVHVYLTMFACTGLFVALAAHSRDRRVAFSLFVASFVTIFAFTSGLLSFALAVLIFGGAGWWLFPRFDRARSAPSLTVTSLFLSIVVVGMYGVFTTLRIRVGSYSGEFLSLDDVARTYVRVATIGVTIGSVTLAASIATWRALRRTVVAKSGRVDAHGFVHLVDGETGRADERADDGKRETFVLAWKTRQVSGQTYREDAGPDRYVTYEGDRASYVEEARRGAMFWHLVGLTACWALGGPLVGFFMGL